MDSKEETSDTDSGIILHSGPDSPTSPTKDLTTHTRAVGLRLQSLEGRLELCRLELKKLCIREAELTGQLSADYPLLSGEKPPCVRRRIGAAFKLHKEIPRQDGEDPELHSLEWKLALQLQICEAAHRLSCEEHPSKAVRRSRLQQCKREAQKVEELRRTMFQLRLQQGRASRLTSGLGPRPGPRETAQVMGRIHGGSADLATSDDSSLSDVAALDEEVEQSQTFQQSREHSLVGAAPLPPLSSPEPSSCGLSQAPTPSLEGLRRTYSSSLECERSPIQNSPWKESSLDQPYHKPKKPQSTCSSRSCSPALPLGDSLSSFHFVPVKSHSDTNSTPSSPELHARRQYSQSFRLATGEASGATDENRGRAQFPRRRVSNVTGILPEYSPLRAVLGNQLYQSSSEDSNSEHSVPSYAGSPCREVRSEATRSCPPPYGYHLASHHNGHHNSLNAGALVFAAPGFYKTSQHQSAPSFYRVGVEEGLGCPLEADMGRHYPGLHPPPGPPPQYKYWSEEAPCGQLIRPLPPHVRLARAPSLREYPQHRSGDPPYDLVSGELESWRQRSRFREARPRSLDRQDAVHTRTGPGQAPLELQHHSRQPVHQRRILQRAPDGTPVQWFEEEDSEIVSQV